MPEFRNKAQYFSPSKLNLFFRVLGKRADGYHEIASLYQAIDFGDYLTLSPSPADRLTCSNPALPCDERNLVWKALKLFRLHYSFPTVHIHLEKRVPMQSGLGGGSGNAATALFALNDWAKSPASIEEIAKLGAQIGSDVAFFFSLGAAYCTGRGEIVEPVIIPALSGHLAKPSFGLSTPQVYRETKVEELEPRDPRKALAGFMAGSPTYFNDLEQAAFRIEPRLAPFKAHLQSLGFDAVSMTGSGTAFFCLGEEKRLATIPFRSIVRRPSGWYCGVREYVLGSES